MVKVEPEETTRLRAARQAAGLSMHELARLSGVKYGVIQGWETKTYVPRSDHALKVAEVMGLDWEDLVHDFDIQRVPREDREEVIA